MKHRLTSFLACALVLGCSAQVPARASEPQVRPPAEPREAPASRTLRFGDAARELELAPFFPDSSHDPAVPAPDSLLRQPLGTFTAHHAEVVAALRSIAAASPRVRVEAFGRTHEGRELVHAVIASPENLARLDAIRADHARLADPRGLSDAEGDAILARTPAVAWLGYSIHGDEMSGTDASLAVAHHLAAGTSADVLELLRELVVVIDPCQNPDGRERILSQLEQSAGYVPNLDVDSMHRGRWPYGRGNHYLFDMNRDWLFGTQPETRARWAAVRSFRPQLFVDAHEMGALDSFLFYPATEPLTPHFPALTRTWWQRFGDDQARAFDRHGWSYYTREWADSWYPGYSDAWATFQGAVGILYEQARLHGQSARRPSGEIATYRDAVRRQATSSLANLTTLAKNRAAILRDSLAAQRAAVAPDTAGNDRMFVLVPGRDAGREARFVDMLAAQGIEVRRARAAFAGRDVETAFAGRVEAREFPAGSLVIPARQPLAAAVKAYLGFDPRYDKAALERERRELERKQQSKSYDVTAWSPAHAFDLDAAWCAAQDVEGELVADLAAPAGALVAAAQEGPVYAWVVDGASDASVAFAARALELGLSLSLSDEPFRASGRSFARSSLLVRRHENGDDVEAKVARAAREAGVEAVATTTARSADDGPDLGGQHFRLLARPRVALLSNSPVSTDAFGHVWHQLDAELGLPCTLVDARELGGYDLRRYNVFVLPEARGDLREILKRNAKELEAWVEGGGTLIAVGSSAAAVANADLGLSSVRLRQDALGDLDAYARAVRRERDAGRTPIDEAALWGDPAAEAPKGADAKDGASGAEPKVDGAASKDPKAPKDGEAAEKEPSSKDAGSGSKPDKKTPEDEFAERDRWMRTFSPQGALLRCDVDVESWLAAGCREELAVLFEGSDVFLSKPPVRTPVRLASAPKLRLGGLLWPEARERIADSAYATIERKGAGQVILFAGNPSFRGWFPGTARLLSNAVVYGPGMGTSQPFGW